MPRMTARVRCWYRPTRREPTANFSRMSAILFSIGRLLPFQPSAFCCHRQQGGGRGVFLTKQRVFRRRQQRQAGRGRGLFLTKHPVRRRFMRRQRRGGDSRRPCIAGSGPPRPRGVWRRARATEKAPWGAGGLGRATSVLRVCQDRQHRQKRRYKSAQWQSMRQS